MNKQKLFKTSVFQEQGINGTQKLCRGGNNCLGIGFAFFSLFKVIFSKVRAVSFNRASHNKGNSSGMGIASFGDSKTCLIVSGLFNNRVQPAKANKFSFIGKSLNINNLSHKIDSRFFSNSRDRGKNFYFSFEKSISYLLDKLRYIFFFFQQIKESIYFNFKQLFIKGITKGNRGRSELINIVGGKPSISTFFRNRGYLFSKFSKRDISYFVSRREFDQNSKDFFRKERISLLNFRKYQSKDSFDFSFSFSNIMGNSFFFSYKVSEAIFFILRMIFISFKVIFIKFQELSNSFSALFVSSRRFRISESEKSPHFIRVNFNSIIPPYFKEVKEIFMVNASRLHANREVRFEIRDNIFKSAEARGIHRKKFIFEDKGAIFNSNRERVFRDINATEVSVRHNSTTSFLRIRGQFTLGLNLPLKMSLEDSINLFETRRAGNTLLNEPIHGVDPLRRKSSGKMLFYPPGFYFTNFNGSVTYKSNIKYHNLN